MKTLKIPKVKYKYTFHFTIWSWNEVAANFKRQAHNPELALAYFMMVQKLESASIKLPSPQCCVISVTASPIDTHHFFKLHWMLYTWLSSLFCMKMIWNKAWKSSNSSVLTLAVKSDTISITIRLITLFRMDQMPHFLSNRSLADSLRLTPYVSEPDDPDGNACAENHLQMKMCNLNFSL